MKQYICPSLTLLLAISAGGSAQASVVAHYPFDLKNGTVIETVSGNACEVEGNFAPENIAGAVGQALRLDGYTTTVHGQLDKVLDQAGDMTVSLWCAVEAYPIIGIDQQTTERVAIVDCLDTEAKSGFEFSLGIHGKWGVEFYAGGWPLTIEADRILPRGEWCHIALTVNSADRKARLYLNGEQVGESRCNGAVTIGGTDILMGYDRQEKKSGPFRLSSFSGMLDDLTIFDETKDENWLTAQKAENKADFVVPASRFADDLLRPRFHGMPSAGWTNETHGMTYSDGRYHVFFQKNPQGPYMARLHWGHISSPNLFDWQEEPIAVAPGESYDIKGCWSGNVFTDDVVSGGKPAIIYTAVDYARATIAMATPEDESLRDWNKSNLNPIINGRPSGLSDDFRDPYFFRNGDNAYIIVGSSRNGVGTTTLHRYNAASGSWSNDGDAFFTGSDVATCGVFWEMPTVTRIGDRWLFTATPLNTSKGVRTLYWTGDIDAQGHFVPDSNSSVPRMVEMISEDGYGLLSPTIYQHNGKTIVLGIVPDKLPGETNHRLGWAHTYSLPREWSLDSKGNLVQRPYEGLKQMRSANVCQSVGDMSFNGRHAFDAVSGRAVEVRATFEAGSAPFGVSLFGNSHGEGVISFNPVTRVLTADFSALNRISNDGHIYKGVYTAILPENVLEGGEVTLDVYADHSVVDIFVNDRWATSIRVFPNDVDADGVALWSAGEVKVKSAEAWCLESDGGAGIGSVTATPLADNRIIGLDGTVWGLSSEVDIAALPKGVYVIDGKTRVIK